MEHVTESHCRLFLGVKRLYFCKFQNIQQRPYTRNEASQPPSLTELTAVVHLSCLRTRHKINNHNSATSSTRRRGLYENEFTLTEISDGFRNSIKIL